MVVRRLNDGRFARFLMRASGPAAAPMTPDELAAYLDGASNSLNGTRFLSKQNGP